MNRGTVLPLGAIKPYAYNIAKQGGHGIQDVLECAGMGRGFWRWNMTGLLECVINREYQLWLTFAQNPDNPDTFYTLVYTKTAE